ncbi:MAG: LPS export ABC transporter periplasmic protein LptC [Limnochordia bacterium]
MKYLYYLAGGLVVVMLVGLGLWALLAPPDDDLVEPSVPTETDPTVGLTTARVVGRHQGRRQWELTAAQMEVEEPITYFQGIQGGTIYHDNAPYLDFRAAGGRWNMERNDFILQGSVKAFDLEGQEIMQTDELAWDGPGEVLVAPQGIWIRWGELILQGDFFQALLGEDRVEIEGNVVLEGAAYRAWARSLVYNLEEEQVTLRGPGRVQLTVEGGRDDE